MTTPRLAPLPPDQIDPEIVEFLRTDKPMNIFATLARHPKLLRRWLVFGNHILGKSTLSVRDRELLILRVGWRCWAPYEWGQHVIIAKQAGITDDEIRRVGEGPEAWEGFDRALITAVDDLHDTGVVSDATWAALGERYDERQLLDTVFTVGQYHLVSFALNSCGVPLDKGVEGFADEPVRARAIAVELPVGDTGAADETYRSVFSSRSIGGVELRFVPGGGGVRVHLAVADAAHVTAKATAAGFSADGAELRDPWGNVLVLEG
jgi:alkylhydroperoxidase family enzyme